MTTIARRPGIRMPRPRCIARTGARRAGVRSTYSLAPEAGLEVSSGPAGSEADTCTLWNRQAGWWLLSEDDGVVTGGILGWNT